MNCGQVHIGPAPYSCLAASPDVTRVECANPSCRHLRLPTRPPPPSRRVISTSAPSHASTGIGCLRRRPPRRRSRAGRSIVRGGTRTERRRTTSTSLRADRTGMRSAESCRSCTDTRSSPADASTHTVLREHAPRCRVVDGEAFAVMFGASYHADYATLLACAGRCRRRRSWSPLARWPSRTTIPSWTDTSHGT